MTEARLCEIEATGVAWVTEEELRWLLDERRRLRAREDAVFAVGYRAGFWDASYRAWTPFQAEVDDAHTEWVEKGRITHLEELE